MWTKINIKENQVFLIQLFFIFVLIEILDSYLDYKFGITFFHTFIQIFLYLFLFSITFYLFNKYYKSKFKVLLIPELMDILNLIEVSENNNLLLNNTNLLRKLKITKPTFKKRIDALINLNYISYEKNGTSKYLRLTNKGKTFLK